MNIIEYFSKLKNIEEKLLNFLDQEDNEEENYENFIKIINDKKIRTNQYDLKIILYLITKISNNHHRLHNFYKKIEEILKTMKDEIKQFFSNEEIFKIFKTNKRILLFLFEEEIFTIDHYIYKEMMTEKFKKMGYPEYFSIEIKPFIEEELKSEENQDQDEKIQAILKINCDEKFNEKRKKGVNDDYIFEFIQNDLIEEFITYVKKENYSVNSYVEESIFETNEFLLKQKKTKLIEYAAFYGSTQIFKYLYKNNAIMTSNLWLYAIHGCDEEIIHILEEKDIKIDDDIDFIQSIKESIKCHHNYITDYIIDNFSKKENYSNDDIFFYCLKYYNLIYLDIEKINYNNLFCYACKYDYFRIVEFLLNTKEINLTDLII